MPRQPQAADPRHPFAESLAFQRQEQGRRTLMLMGKDFHDCAAWLALSDADKRIQVARGLHVPAGSNFSYEFAVSRIDEYCAANAPEGSVAMASGALFGKPQASGMALPGGARPAFPLGPSGMTLPGGARPGFPLGPSGMALPGGARPAFPLGPSGQINPGIAAAEAEARARGGRALLLIGLDCLTWSRMPFDNKVEALRRGLRTPPVTRLDFDRAINEMDAYCTSMGFPPPVRATGFAAATEYKSPLRSGGSAITGLFGKNAGTFQQKTSASGQLTASANTLTDQGRALDVAMHAALARNDYATYERLWKQASQLTQAARIARMDAFSRPGMGLADPQSLRASGQIDIAPMSIVGGLSAASWNGLSDVDRLTYLLNNAQTTALLEETRNIGLEQGYRGITEAVNAAEAAMGLDRVAASGTAGGWENQARELVHASGQTAVTESAPGATNITATPAAATPVVAAKMTVSPWVVAGLGAAVIAGVVIYRKSSKEEPAHGPYGVRGGENESHRGGSNLPNPSGQSPYYPVAR